MCTKFIYNINKANLTEPNALYDVAIYTYTGVNKSE